MGFCAWYSGAGEYSRLCMKPSVHRREWTENQTCGCYSGSDDAELNSLVKKTIKSQAFFGSKD